MAAHVMLVATALLCALGASGCPSPAEAPPSEARGAAGPPNPDFLIGSKWINENPAAQFREIRITPDRHVVVVFRGEHRLPLSPPNDKQGVLSGYPLAVARSTAVWFTDDRDNPSAAQLALMLPVERGSAPSRAAAGYVVLLGAYLRGLDAMEWDVFDPVLSADGASRELRPIPVGGLYRGKLLFRRML